VPAGSRRPPRAHRLVPAAGARPRRPDPGWVTAWRPACRWARRWPGRATVVMPARCIADSMAPTMRARVHLDMVSPRSVSWRCVDGQLAGRRPRRATGGPAATSHGQFAADADAASERHLPAAHGRPAGGVR
jgi:hypothetical protein